MIATVIGKRALSGTSKKTGKPYAMNQLVVSYTAAGYEGQACTEIVLPRNVSFDAFIVGHKYDFQYDVRGYFLSAAEVK